MRHTTMNEFLTGQFPQLQHRQQPASPGAMWPQYPPQGIFNPGMAQMQQYYPAMVPTPPQLLPQSPVPGPAPGEQPPWFQALVAAVSKELKSGEKKAVERDVDSDKDNMASTLLSVEDEKALIDGLKKWKEGGMRMQQVFEELSQKNGHPEIVWKTWFIANFEKLNSKVILNPNTEHTSARSTGSTSGSRSQAASRTRSTSINRPLRSSTLTATNERRHSRDEPQSEGEEPSDDSDLGSTYRDSDRSASRDPWPPCATKDRKTTPIGRPPRAYKQRGPVTDADLRAMALYMFKKGDGPEAHRYPLSYWREFAQRPENRRKRTLDAWNCIPRKPAHAAAIERYVEKYQRAAERAKSENRFMTSPSLGAGMQHAKVAGRTMQDHPSLKRKKASQDVDQDYIIDLTVEKEE